MTAAVYRCGTSSTGVAPTQNTAPVVEFNCMYTHDIRRKQKRWQDGVCRYHTFNKRIMVYDMPRNFIGDAHWKSGEPLQDGDEVILEEEGVMVQVAESIGSTETDLTALRHSRRKAPNENTSSPAAQPVPATLHRPNPSGIRIAAQSKHRSLNALLGSKAQLGKASLPTKSPFDERYAGIENQEWPESRSAKRQRTSPQAWTVSRTTKPPASKEPPLWVRTVDSAKRARKETVQQRGQQQPRTNEIINLCEDIDEPQPDKFLAGFSSDALVPPSSPQRLASPAKSKTVRSSSPAFQVQSLPVVAAPRWNLTTTRPKSVSGVFATHPTAPSPPRHDRDQHAVDCRGEVDEMSPDHAATSTPEETSMIASVAKKSRRSPSNEGPRTLRLRATSHRKKSLVCQDQLSLRTSGTYSLHNESPGGELLHETPREAVVVGGRSGMQRVKLQQRLARIREKGNDTEEPKRQDEPSWTSLQDSDDIGKGSSLNAKARPTKFLQQSPSGLAEQDQMFLTSPRAADTSTTTPTRSHEPRQLRRVVSDSGGTGLDRSKRTLGIPVHALPSPSKKPYQAPHPDSRTTNARTRDEFAQRPGPRGKKMSQRAVSLSVASNGTSTVILSKQFQPPKASSSVTTLPPQAPEPWSREAFDLFTWRPPGWDESAWSVKVSNEGVVVDSRH